MNKTKLLFSVIALFTALTAHCQKFSVGDLNFTILDADARTVQLSGGGTTDDTLHIPGTVENEGVTYTITSVNLRLNRFSPLGKNVTTITVPKTVTEIVSIGGQIIKNILFEEGSQLATIKERAFSNCSRMDSITFENCRQLKTIGTTKYYSSSSNGVFHVNIKKVVLPESVKYIGDHAFTGTQIKELTLSNLKYLGTSAFKDCESLQSINIPENIDTIRSRTFEGCISLTELKLPYGLEVIENSAFNGTAVKEFVLPENLKEIGSNAFRNTTIYPTGAIPAELSSHAFEDHVDVIIKDLALLDAYMKAPVWSDYVKGPEFWAYNVKYRFQTSTTAIVCDVTGSSVTIPDTVNYEGYRLAVTKIEDYSLNYQCREVYIKAKVTTIGQQDFTFFGRGSELSKIELPNTLQRIEEKTFWCCKKLKSIDLPDSISYIGPQAFANSGIENFTAPKSLTGINVEVFASCNSLKIVTLHDDITYIDVQAFSYTAIESIKLPKNLLTLDSESFSNCKNLKELTLPAGIKNIELSAIGGTAITELRIPHTINNIYNSFTFNNYSSADSLKNIFINGGTNPKYFDIDGVLFRNLNEKDPQYNPDTEQQYKLLCYPANRDAAEYNVPAGTTVISSSAFQKSSGNTAFFPLKKVVLPESVTVIEPYAFAYNPQFESVNLPEGLTRIEDYAFRSDLRLNNVRIPNTVNYIGSMAFNITTVFIDAIEPPTCRDQSPLQTTLICVKPEALEAYRNHEVWGKYRRIECDVHNINGLIYVAHGSTDAELAGYVTMPDSTLNIPQTVTIDGTQMNVTTIGDQALVNAATTAINVPRTMENIGTNSFTGCYELTSVNIAYAKLQMPNLTLLPKLHEITIGNNNGHHTLINGVLYNKTANTLQVYPYALDCETYVLPESVNTIEEYVLMHFSYNNKDLLNLKALVSLATTPPDCHTGFNFSRLDNTTLYVPKNSMEAYQTARGWNNFQNIIGLTEEEINAMLTGIKGIEADNATTNPDGNGTLHTLDGRCTSTPAKGLYIRNGKKVIVR